MILATGDLGHVVDNRRHDSFLSALTDAEWAALAKFERDVRHPPAERLHGAVAAPRPERPGRRRRPGRPQRHPHRRRQGGLPVPQGPDPDPERRRRAESRRSATRARRSTRPTGRRSSPARRRRRRVPRHLHAPGGRARGDGDDASRATSSRRTTRRCATGCSTGSPAASSSAIQRNYLGIDVDDIFLAGRQVGRGRSTSRTTTSRRDPHDAGGRGQRGRVAEPHRPAADHGLQHGRRRLYDGVPGSPHAAHRVPGRTRTSSAGSTTRCQHPNLDCTTQAYTQQPDHAEPDALQPADREPVAAGPQRPERGSSPASTPAWRTRGRATRARSTRRAFDDLRSAHGRHARRGDVRLRRSRRTYARRDDGLDRAGDRGAAGNSGVVATWQRRSATRSRSLGLPAPRAPGAWTRLGTTPVTGTPRPGFTLPRRSITGAGAADVTFVDTDGGGAGDRARRRRRRTARRSSRTRRTRQLVPALHGCGHPARSPRTPPSPTRARRRGLPLEAADELPEGRLVRRRPGDPRGPALPVERLLQRRQPGGPARRVQLDLHVAAAGGHACRSPRSRPATRRRWTGRSTSTARRGSCSAT